MYFSDQIRQIKFIKKYRGMRIEEEEEEDSTDDKRKERLLPWRGLQQHREGRAERRDERRE